MQVELSGHDEGNGNLLIDKACAAMFDLQPGGDFEIKLVCKQIRLTPVGGTHEDEDLMQPADQSSFASTRSVPSMSSGGFCP